MMHMSMQNDSNRRLSTVDRVRRKHGKEAKYRTVYNALLGSIRRGNYSPGDKLPTDAELMEQFNVSRITVIRALLDLKTAGLIRRGRGSGTYIESPRHVQVGSLGVIFPQLDEGSIFATVHQVLAREATRLGWRIIFKQYTPAATTEQTVEMFNTLCVSDMQGVLYLPPPVSGAWFSISESIVQECTLRHIPLVLLDRDVHRLSDRSAFDVVGSDNEEGGFLIGRHLIQRGCKCIVFFSDSEEFPTAEARLEGVRKAASSTSDSVRVCSCIGDADNIGLIKKILAEYKPDAVACLNDRLAAKMLRTMMKIGVKIPAKIKLTGFDDTSTASLLPVPLTTVRQSAEAMAIHALNMMRQRVERSDLPASTVATTCSLVIRESTS